ncbi:MAG: alkaline phosphatase family protein [Firmicutes bacterium]|nr:alkaline phosphatase family protein [Bacillota bacterium]
MGRGGIRMRRLPSPWGPGRRAVRRRALLLALLLLATAGCAPAGAPAARRPAPAPGAAPPAASAPQVGATGLEGVPAFSHVLVVVMENQPASALLAPGRTPQLERLMRGGATAVRYYAVAHPSLPNYLFLLGGSTFDVRSDCWFCYVDAPNLVDLLEAAGISWKAYMEGLPSPGWLGPWYPPGDYAGKHDPFRYFQDIRRSPTRLRHLVGFDQLRQDLATGRLPAFAFIVPDLCHDGHDCPLAEADAWLGGFVRQVEASPAWDARSVLFVLWDEGSGADTSGAPGLSPGGGRTLLLALSPLARAGYRSDLPFSHASLLRTVEDAWRLPRLGASASPAVRPLAPLFRDAATAGSAR